MINILNEVLQRLRIMTQDHTMWDSVIINKAKPVTYRVFTNFFNGISYRVCLHKFEKCSATESFWHPHGWPAAFKILKGSYELELAYSSGTTTYPRRDREHKLVLTTSSIYEMVHQYAWHKLTPLEETWTVMVNGPDYSWKHRRVRTTKDKSLEKMKEDELRQFLFEAGGLL